MTVAIPGIVVEIPTREGQIVKKGDVLVKLESTLEELDVLRRKLIWEDTSQLEVAEAKLTFLKQDYEVARRLFEETQSLSSEEFRKTELDYQTALAEYNGLKAAEEREKIEWEMATEEFEKKNVKAPFSGTIVSINKELGELTSQQEPLVHLVDTQNCRFIGHVNSHFALLFKKDKKVKINLTQHGQNILSEGIVEFVSPIVDPASGLREIKVLINNQDQKILAGLEATIEIKN